MIEIILSGVISGISAGICAFLIGKKLKNDIKYEIFDWLNSQEGMQTIASIGKIFGAGVLSVIKIKPRTSTMNIFGFKIPTELVMAIISKSFGEETKNILETLKSQ